MKQNKKCAGNCGKNCADEACQMQQRIFEREVDEELRQERLRKWWMKYRFVVVGGVIGVILGTIISEWYAAWQKKVSIAESDRYENAVILGVQGETEQALAELDLLAQDGKTGYRHIAKIAAAGILLDEGKKAKGYDMLLELAQDEQAPKALRDMALVSYVGHRSDNGNTVEMQQLLSPVLADTTSPFYGMAVEQAVLMHLLSAEQEQATALLDKALTVQTLTPQLRERLINLKGEIK